ncbi:MAG: hypothetical protein, partial [Olavius algarvensis Gamma 1 endosymbiont]
PTAPSPLRPAARAYAYRGLPASRFALPWRAAAVFLVLIGLAGGARSLSQCLVLWSDGVLQRVAG